MHCYLLREENGRLWSVAPDQAGGWQGSIRDTAHPPSSQCYPLLPSYYYFIRFLPPQTGQFLSRSFCCLLVLSRSFGT